jgi:hypothetical protein
MIQKSRRCFCTHSIIQEKGDFSEKTNSEDKFYNANQKHQDNDDWVITIWSGSL